MNNLRKICHESYPFINNLLPILNGYNTDKLGHNARRIQSKLPNRTTFDGYSHSAGSSYLLNYYLDKKGTAQRVKILFDRQRNLYFCFFFVKLLFSKNY